MDRFQAMQVFTRVVDVNSFSLAAETLGLPRATVSTTIQNLEKLLHTKLLNRTTRRISLTDDGAAYYDRCVRILAEVEEAEQSMRDVTQKPGGRLRIDVPGIIGRNILIPFLCSFHHRYPDITIMMGMGDRPVDLVQEGVDCVIRIGEITDNNMVARRIGAFDSIVAAAPSYLSRMGVPQSLEDLYQHQAVHYFATRSGQTIDWEFIIDGKSMDLKLPGVLSVNDSDAYLTAGLQGFGLLQIPRFMALPHLEKGELVEVLPQLKSAPMPISVVYPQNRHLSSKVRVFVDWVAELFSECPLLGGCPESVKRMEGSQCVPAGNTIRRVIEEQNMVESAL